MLWRARVARRVERRVIAAANVAGDGHASRLSSALTMMDTALSRPARRRTNSVSDRVARVTYCLSHNWAGTATGNRLSSSPVLSPDGRTVAFQSFASDLVPGDYNDTRDVFVVSLAGPDSDGDGLDDDWEVAYFNDLSRDGTGDFDGDGASDAQEFRAGTDPTNAGSVFRVLTLTTFVGPQAPFTRATTIFVD